MLAIYLFFGVFLGTINPPITNTAVSGMPRSMAGVAASLASAGRQTGTTLGVAIAGTIVGSSVAGGGTAFIERARTACGGWCSGSASASRPGAAQHRAPGGGQVLRGLRRCSRMQDLVRRR